MGLSHAQFKSLCGDGEAAYVHAYPSRYHDGGNARYRGAMAWKHVHVDDLSLSSDMSSLNHGVLEQRKYGNVHVLVRYDVEQ